ncbi:MAG: AAA family ATPase [Methanoregula sp.]
MDVLQEILAWSKDLPHWQNDAIVRLFENHTPSADDIEDLYALLKSEHGIPDPKKRKPQKLKSDQIAIPVNPRVHIELLGIKNLVNVNAIADKQKLLLGPTGLTVIYGDNGSGKSGYSRVLKRACRARDQTEQILPNAYLHPSKTGKAEAIFELRVNDVDQEVVWIDGKPAPELLSTIAIFDHYCARAYLDKEGDFSYIPYGFDIFDGLVKICDTLKLKISNEIDQNVPDVESLSELSGSTSVGCLVENLSSATENKQVEKLATLAPEEIAQHGRLFKNIHEIDPKGKANQLRIKCRRINRLLEIINEKTIAVNDTNLAHLEKFDKDYLAAHLAAEIAANNFKITGDYLPGTGGEAWRELFDAARKFSKEAYPDKLFPHIEDGAKCPLCQQLLERGAKHFQLFEDYIHQETEKNSREHFNSLSEAKRNFSLLDVSVGLDDEILEEISQSDKNLAKKCQRYQKSLIDRYSEILSAFTSHIWTNIAPLSNCPVEELSVLMVNLDNEADILERMVDNSARKSLETQFYEYDSRMKLSKSKGAVLAVIEKMRRQSQLKECLSELDTTGITKKRHDLSQNVITPSLLGALKQELKKLDVLDLNLNWKSIGNKGKTNYKLILDLPGVKNPRNILSEGEQRAIAIASFLAEVDLKGGSAGIIFDDPISSLDHRRRELVAQRLVQESNKRQVIIFTHDLYFLFVLIDEAEKTGIPFETQSLIKKGRNYGIPESGNPFEGMNTSARVKFLRAKHQVIAKIHRDGDEVEFRKQTKEAYSLLRSAWERGVEEVLLRQVVLRFRQSIETQRLRDVFVDDSDHIQIKQAINKCSKITEAHDTAMAIGIRVPPPDELLEDINTLEKWRLSVEKRSNDVRERRK